LIVDKGDDIQIILIDKPEEADVNIVFDNISEQENFLWALAPVVPFFSIFDGISSGDLKKFWNGDSDVLEYI